MGQRRAQRDACVDLHVGIAMSGRPWRRIAQSGGRAGRKRLQPRTRRRRTQRLGDSDRDIVVTARRRNEVLQDVPIAVTAYSGEQLERQGALDITDVGDTTPNVTLETSRGTNSTLTAFIRGVGQQDPVAGFEQGVGIYLDDVYLNRPQGAVLDIYDVERIEVLRGPQGTLYGRNTIGGAVKYVTRRLADDAAMQRSREFRHLRPARPRRVSASTPLGDSVQGRRVGRAAQPRRLRQEPHDRQRKLQQGHLGGRGTVEFEPSRQRLRPHVAATTPRTTAIRAAATG